MNVTTDFFIRMVGAQDGFRIPVLKQKIEDSNCLMTIKICGDQQTFMDVSRCEKLTPTFINRTIPLSCPNLLYLDISFTRVDELTTIFAHCIHLKVINLSGCSLMSPTLKGIQQLQSLEVIGLRSSNIDDISALDELQCVRSLDLGCMTLKKVDNAFQNKHRLEELLFDYTSFTDENVISDIIDSLSDLSALKLLNLINSELEPEILNIKEIIEIPVYYEPKSRRELFFRAIIDNNVNEAYFYLTSGQDINAKIEKSDELWLTDIWIERCYYQKTRLQTPFFIFNPIQEEIDDVFTVYDFFPTALHLALFFNAYECVQMLLANHADQEEEVYIGDVLFEKTERILYEQYSYGTDPTSEGGPGNGPGKRSSAFLLSTSKSMKNVFTEGLENRSERKYHSEDPEDPMLQQQNFLSKKLYKLKELIHYLYQKNVHRFTGGLMQKRVNWKSICDRFKKRLLYLVDTYDPQKVANNAQALRGNDSFNVMTIAELNSRKTFAINLDPENNSSSLLASEGSDSMLVLTDVVSRPTTSEMKEGERERKTDSSLTVPIGHKTIIESSTIPENTTVEKENSPKKSPSKLNRSVSFAINPLSSLPPPTNPPLPTTDSHNDSFNPDELPFLQIMKQQQQQQQQPPSSSTPVLPSLVGNDTKEIVTILPAKPKLFEWYQHGLVSKIVGAPRIYQTIETSVTEEQKKAEEADALFNNWMLNSTHNDTDLLNITTSTSERPSTPETNKQKSNKRRSRLDQELAAIENIVADFKQKQQQQQQQYRQKGLKLHQKKMILALPKEISVLGKQSFWLESRKTVIEEAVTRREEQEIYPSMKHIDLYSQKKMFLQNLKLRHDQKTREQMQKSLVTTNAIK